MNRNKNIFISYAKENLKDAYKLFNDLKQKGLFPWLDKESILGGQNWKIEITNAIKRSDYFIALLSSTSISKKGYVQKELKEAMEILDKYPNSDVFIIPVRLDECQPTDPRLEELQWVDLFESYERGLTKILYTINSNNINNNTVNRDESFKMFEYGKYFQDSDEILLLYISKGLTSQEISEKMQLSKRTIDAQRIRIMKLANLKSVSDLIRFSIIYIEGKNKI